MDDDRLIALLIEIVADAPMVQKPYTHKAQIRWRLIKEARIALDELGIDWVKVQRGE